MIDRKLQAPIESSCDSASVSHSLPPRSTAGQLTLDQHIGVRIPGGQPILFKHFHTILLRLPRRLLRGSCVLLRPCFRVQPGLLALRCGETAVRPVSLNQNVSIRILCALPKLNVSPFQSDQLSFPKPSSKCRKEKGVTIISLSDNLP